MGLDERGHSWLFRNTFLARAVDDEREPTEIAVRALGAAIADDDFMRMFPRLADEAYDCAAGAPSRNYVVVSAVVLSLTAICFGKQCES